MSIQDENGQVYGRAAQENSPNDPAMIARFVAQLDETFCTDPSLYDWKYIDKREMFVPYNCAAAPSFMPQDSLSSSPSHAHSTRWEKHRVRIVEGTVRHGESNVLTRRRFYIDEDYWAILLGEAYDNVGEIVASYMLTDCVIPITSKRGKWYTV